MFSFSVSGREVFETRLRVIRYREVMTVFVLRSEILVVFLKFLVKVVEFFRFFWIRFVSFFLRLCIIFITLFLYFYRSRRIGLLMELLMYNRFLEWRGYLSCSWIFSVELGYSCGRFFLMLFSFSLRRFIDISWVTVGFWFIFFYVFLFVKVCA